MPPSAFITPVCLIIFRRPEHTRRVLEVIAQVRPSRLFVVADGPRPDRPDDMESCAATRALIDQIDWPCEIIKNYAEKNLGCGKRPASGIDWLFEQVDEAIILEDDCVPDPSFFRFCAELLEKYRDDQRVMHISGSSYRADDAPVPHSYYFARCPGCWGWATWKRAWKYYDLTVRIWPMVRNTSLLRDAFGSENAASDYHTPLEAAYERKGDCSFWDYQWGLACLVNSGLSIYPRCNLVSNVGWDENSTHTFGHDSPTANLQAREMEFPLVHPEMMIPNRQMELEFAEEIDQRVRPPKRGLKRAMRSVRRRFKRALPTSLLTILGKSPAPDK